MVKRTAGSATHWLNAAPEPKVPLARLCLGECFRISNAGRALHGEAFVEHRVIVIAAARDRLHGGGVEQPVPDKAFVYVHADHAADHHPTIDRLAVDIVELDR